MVEGTKSSNEKLESILNEKRLIVYIGIISSY